MIIPLHSLASVVVNEIIRLTAVIFKDATCNHCGKKGHISKVCCLASSKKPTQSSQSYKTKAVKRVETDQTAKSESDADSEPLAIDRIDGRSSHPITVQLEIQGKQLVMEVDTGAAVSVISEETYDNLFSQVPLTQASVGLRTYTGESISICGKISVVVRYGTQTKKLSLVVVKGKGHNLFGRTHFRLDWGLATVEKSSTSLEMLLEHYTDVFAEGLSSIQHYM